MDTITCLQCGRSFPFDESMDEDLLVQFVCDDCIYGESPCMTDHEFDY